MFRLGSLLASVLWAGVVVGQFQWESLFNGVDTSGWYVSGSWTVAAGVIRNTSAGNDSVWISSTLTFPASPFISKPRLELWMGCV